MRLSFWGNPLAGLLIALMLTACGGGGGANTPSGYTISGIVSGLGAGNQVSLLNNAGNATTISANGSFSFTTPIAYNGSFAVTVGTQPTGQTCTVTNGSGSGVVANISNVQVVCSDYGKLTTRIGSVDSRAMGVIVQTDGKIVVAGYNNDFAVIRYNIDGGLDTSFSGTGIVTTNISGRVASDEWVRGVALQSDGKIVVAGYTSQYGTGTTELALTRYNSDGSLDTTFAGTGIVKTSDSSRNLHGNAVAIQSDGKILVAGSINCTSRFVAGYCTLLVRYNSDGSLDGTFSGYTTSVDSSTLGAQGLALQSDGKILVVGSKDNGNGLEFAVARYNADGTHDTGFGTNGVTTVAIGSQVGDSNTANGIALQSDGKIILMGSARTNSANNHFALSRILTNGAIDTSFGQAGSVTTNIGGGSGIPYSVVVQPDGKILVAGESSYPNATPYPYPGFHMPYNADFTLVRYNSNGSLDTSFSGTGITTTDFKLLADRSYCMALQADGSIVLAGESLTWDPAGAYNSFAVARYTSSGNLDPTFASAP